MQVLRNRKRLKVLMMIGLLAVVWLLLIGYYHKFHNNTLPEASKVYLQQLNNSIYPVSIVNLCSKKIRIVPDRSSIWPLSIVGGPAKPLMQGTQVGPFFLEELYFERLYSDENRHYGDFVLTIKHDDLVARKRVPLLLTKLNDKYGCMMELMPFKL